MRLTNKPKEDRNEKVRLNLANGIGFIRRMTQVILRYQKEGMYEYSGVIWALHPNEFRGLWPDHKLVHLA